MRHRAGRWLVAAFAVAMGTGVSAAPGASAPSFEAAVERNLAAVTARDYEALEESITEGERLLLIFPNGHLTHSRADYLSFHREWFADPGWTMAFERIAVDVDGNYGHALYRSTYDGDGSGPEEPRSSYLTLGFRLENGQWRLVHDQNTRIATER
jgi:ketosteroid isomerase-like protein